MQISRRPVYHAEAEEAEWRKLSELAAKESRSMSYFIRLGVRMVLEKHKKKADKAQ